ncbi:MAG: C4-dicarboxylate TRAP transporter substrate-binding protein [Hyphomicrobiaceae bacterium]
MKRALTALGIAAATAIAIAAPAEARELRGVYFVSPKHPIGIGYQFLADEMKRETEGAVTIRNFAGESLLAAKAISDGVRDGVADIGQVVMTYTPAYYPHGVVINDLAMVGPNDMAGMMAVTEIYLLHCPGCLAEFDKQNQLPLSGISTPPYVIIANGDFNSLEKIRLKKLRAAGSLWDRFCRSIGAVAVNMPTAGMYEAMSRGTLDGALYAVGGLKTHGLSDVAKQVIMLNTGSFRAGALYSTSKTAWKSLAPDQRKALLRSISKAVVRTTAAFLEGDVEGLAAAKAKNIPVVQPDPELLRRRNEFVENDLKLTVKNATEHLHLADGAEFVANYRKYYDKYEKLVVPVATDEKKLAEILWSEVYSKIDVAKFGLN